MLRGRSVQIGMVILFELSIALGHRGLKVPGLDLSCDILGGLDCFHKRRPHDFVLADGNDRRRGLWRHFKHSTNSLHTLQGREPAVISTRRTATLSVAQDSGTSVQAKSLCENILDLRTRNFVEMAILRTLGNNYDCTTLASLLAVLSAPRISC